LLPILPGKFLFVVEIITSLSCALPIVSIGPPRHAAQEDCAITQPDFSNISFIDTPEIVSSSSCAATAVLAGTINVGILTSFPNKSFAAETKSLSLPPVQEPI
jgi:hypothetical protein